MKIIIVNKKNPIDTQVWDLSKVCAVRRLTYDAYPENPAYILSIRMTTGFELSYADNEYDFYHVTANLTREPYDISKILESWSRI